MKISKKIKKRDEKKVYPFVFILLAPIASDTHTHTHIEYCDIVHSKSHGYVWTVKFLLATPLKQNTTHIQFKMIQPTIPPFRENEKKKIKIENFLRFYGMHFFLSKIHQYLYLV